VKSRSLPAQWSTRRHSLLLVCIPPFDFQFIYTVQRRALFVCCCTFLRYLVPKRLPETHAKCSRHVWRSTSSDAVTKAPHGTYSVGACRKWRIADATTALSLAHLSNSPWHWLTAFCCCCRVSVICNHSDIHKEGYGGSPPSRNVSVRSAGYVSVPRTLRPPSLCRNKSGICIAWWLKVNVKFSKGRSETNYVK